MTTLLTLLLLIATLAGGAYVGWLQLKDARSMYPRDRKTPKSKIENPK
jgi:hypothetical protein